MKCYGCYRESHKHKGSMYVFCMLFTMDMMIWLCFVCFLWWIWWHDYVLYAFYDWYDDMIMIKCGRVHPMTMVNIWVHYLCSPIRTYVMYTWCWPGSGPLWVVLACSGSLWVSDRGREQRGWVCDRGRGDKQRNDKKNGPRMCLGTRHCFLM